MAACGAPAPNVGAPATPAASARAEATAPPPLASAPAKPEYPATAEAASRRPLSRREGHGRLSLARGLGRPEGQGVVGGGERLRAEVAPTLPPAARRNPHARVEQLLAAPTASWTGLTSRERVVLRAREQAAEAAPIARAPDVTDRPRDRANPRRSGRQDRRERPATAIGWFVPTPDGKHVAVSLSKGGGERGDRVHVYDVATGKEGKDVVPQADGAGSGDCLRVERGRQRLLLHGQGARG